MEKVSRQTIIFVIVIELLSIIIVSYFMPPSNTDTARWFLSTIAQSFSALIALVIMVLVYKLDIAEKRLDSVKKHIIEFILYAENTKENISPAISDQRLYERCLQFEKTMTDREGGIKNEYYLNSYKCWKEISKAMTDLKSMVLKYGIITIVGAIFVPLVSLSIIDIGIIVLIKILFAITIFLTFISLFLLVKILLVLTSVKEKIFWDSIK